MDKSMWLGPVSVLAFVVLLTVMYGWVGTTDLPAGKPPERSDLNQANLATPQAAGTGDNPAQLINNQPNISAGNGQGPDAQIKLINKPDFPVGAGQGPDANMQLIAQAAPGTAYLGVMVGEVPKEVANHLGLPPGIGLYVMNVAVDSPAEKAGIKAGNVILKCAHRNLTAHQQLGRILDTRKPGEVVKLVVQRARGVKSYHVQLAAAPQGMRAAAAVRRPTWMGADIQDIDTVMKMQFELPDTRGVIVSHVQPQSPAATAGLATGDVIRRFQGTRIADAKQLQKLILKTQPGTRVQLTVLRGGRNQTLPVIMGQGNPANTSKPFLSPADMAVDGTWIGMDLSELGAKDAAALGLPAGTRGVLVNNVESPPASTVGFQAGDVILAVNGRPTPDMKNFVAATQKQNSAVVDLVRGNKHLFVSVPPPGYTVQGTQGNTPVDKKLRQVGATHTVNSRIAILTAAPDLNAAVTGDVGQPPHVILVDLNRNAYTVLALDARTSLVQALAGQRTDALIGRNLKPATIAELRPRGIAIYPGVTGRVRDVIGLYKSGQLLPLGG